MTFPEDYIHKNAIQILNDNFQSELHYETSRCPFCGSPLRIFASSHYYLGVCGHTEIGIKCPATFLQFIGKTPQDIINRWETRPQQLSIGLIL